MVSLVASLLQLVRYGKAFLTTSRCMLTLEVLVRGHTPNSTSCDCVRGDCRVRGENRVGMATDVSCLETSCDLFS